MFYSRFLSWCLQRVANLGFVALLCLMFLAFWYDRPAPRQPDDVQGGFRKGGKGHHRHYRRQITASQLALVYYTIFVHVLGLLFPVRLCYAIRSMIKNLKLHKQIPPTRKRISKTKFRTTESESGYEDSTPSDFSESEIELSSIESDTEDEPLVHAIIVPNYKEDMDTLRETLEGLASHPLARSSYEIYLAMEAAESGAAAKANVLIDEFERYFKAIESVIHPRDIPGEAQGKSSNLCWAARYINGKHSSEKSKQNVITTVMDADSHLMSKYFTLINELHLCYPETAETTMYVPPIIFDRNAHLVPRLVRVADLLWGGAGLSGHYETSSICPPTSVYSLPLSLVDRAGGWDAGEEAIGEDLHMYVKCFFAVNGHLTTRSVFSAASHSNVHSSGKGIRGFFQNIQARYKQAMRHMWGALDSGYVLKNLSRQWWGRRVEGKRNTLILMHRMYEAHFLPIHITLLILGGGLYMLFTPSNQIPRLLLQVLNLMGYLRLVSALNFIYFFFLYEEYHSLCVTARQQEMTRAGLAGHSFSHRSLKATGLDFCLFPVAGIVFGTVPAVVALVCQFWTLKLVYKVSRKPKRINTAVP